MRIALDPWGSDYTSQFTVAREEDGANNFAQALEEPVEERPWAPIRPSLTTLPKTTAVVDGVMRTDASAIVMDENRRALALFSSYAAGAVVINARVQIVHDRVQRLFLAGGNWSEPEDLMITAGTGGAVCYQGVSCKADTYEHLREALTTEMRQAEAQVAEALSEDESLVLADGNLTSLRKSSSVVGVIKTIHRMYLVPPKALILEHLQPGERTPLFRVVSGRESDGYSVFTAYLRLTLPQPTELPFAGLVRLEAKASLGPQRAVELIDQAAVKVRDLASRAPKDPRAPQNLIPIGGLERHLRHRLGDPQLLLRGIKQKIRAMLDQTAPA
jgi:hypothetical protein